MKRNRIITILGILIPIILASFALEYHFLRIDTDALTKIILLLLFNFSIVSLLVLTFFVTKTLFKLIMEKRRKVLGYKFRTRIVAIFVGLTLVPSSFLFFISSGIVTNYIDRWFDPQVMQPLEDSLELSKAVYENEREQTISRARKVIRGEDSRDNITVTILTALPENPTETVKNAFQGKEGTEVISHESGDVIRAVIPEVAQGKVMRVFIAESTVPVQIVQRIDSIRLSQERFLATKKLKKPIKFNYLVVLAFFTSLIVFTAMWVSLKISRGITEPIEVLAEATEEIAAGNLDVRIAMTRDDEIGMLVASFNRMVVEIKESKQSLEDAYYDSDRRRVCMESILENVRSGVISLDNDGKILTINSAACAILGIDPSTVFARDLNYGFLLDHIDSEGFRNFIRSINLRKSKTVTEQMTLMIRGRKVIMRIFITQLTLPDGHPVGVLVVFDDLTDVIRAQQVLTWQEVARRIAHEIKNPLTPIRLSAERILRKWSNRSEDMDSAIQKSTQTIIREVESLRKMVDEFSRFGKMPEIRKERIDIRVLLSEVAELYKNYGGVKISLGLPENFPAVEVDPQQFKRVIINLFDNAITAMEGKGEIAVTLGRDDGREETMTLVVADTGSGIPAEDKEKLFLPYFSRKKDGTGLGLAISHRIIAEHGGTITADDNTPKGAKFVIQMPV